MPEHAQVKAARQQLRQVFEFLEQWHIHQVDVARDWRLHAWTLSLLELPNHPFVEVGRVEGTTDSGFVLRVRRPNQTPCLKPPEELQAWVEHGWQDPDGSAAVLPSRNHVVEGDTVTERFDEDPSRLALFDAWTTRRDAWREAEAPVRKAVALFQRLFELRGRLERDSERSQFVLGQGLLRVRDPSGVVEHPLLLQRVELTFDSKLPQFEVVFSDDPPELNTALLRNIQATEARQLGPLRERIRAGEAHLLDRTKCSSLLVELAHSLFANGQFAAEPSLEGATDSARLSLSPVLMLVPRMTRYTEAIRATVDRLGGEEPLPPPLVGIVGLPLADAAAVQITADHRSSDGARTDASPVAKVELQSDLLLTKPANEAQERILRQLERTRTVVVQGPPGTGKTHTIGNLIGHFLAQGKRVLVASHTSKALRVLRDNIVDSLRPLCVSVLDSDAESRTQLAESVHGITRRLSEDNPDQLEREASQLKLARERLLRQLHESEQALERAIADEYESLVASDKTYQPSDAARLLREWGPSHTWIPGEIDPAGPLPISVVEVRELYALSTEVDEAEEGDLDGDLPDPAGLPTPHELREAFGRETALRARDLRVPDDAWIGEPPTDTVALSGAWRLLSDALREVIAMRDAPHLIECIDASRTGGAARELWDDFVAFIFRLRDQISRDEALARRRTVVVRLEAVDDRSLAAIRDLRAALTHKKTVFRLAASLAKGIHPTWKRILDSCEVEGKRPVTDDQLEAIEAYVRVHVHRTQLVHRWRIHLEPYKDVASLNLGDRPEIACSQHLDRLHYALGWHERHWTRATEALSLSGIALNTAIRKAAPRSGRFAEIDRLIDAAQNFIAVWLKRRLDALELQELSGKIDIWIGRAQRVIPSRDVSGLARAIATALRARDLAEYESAHERLVALERKRASLVRRRQLIGMLGRAAPGWADAIANRRPPHDQDFAPGDPEKAWVCRQLTQELERRGRIDIVVCQARVTELRKALHEKTAEYVDRLAWARQHRRVGQPERQALQGWLATVESRGFESGVRSAQLKSQARRLLDRSRTAVPVWIMTIARAVDSLDFANAKFDVVIMDEASQCDMLGMLLLALGSEAVVVGDDKQVSPIAVGEVLSYTQKLIDEYLRDLPTRELFTGRLSLYDMATQSFGDVTRLVEHFRCAEDIISFSNYLSYGGTIRPLRDTSAVVRRPHVVAHRVAGGKRVGDVNEAEALETASLVAAAIEQPEYRGASFGVITMLKDRQALEIDAILRRRLSEAVYEQARILCGTPPQFQGDERDVVFLGLVDSGESGPLPLRRDPDLQKRYNVAASRARDQLWVIHSLDPDRALKEHDLRLRLLRHAMDPGAAARQQERIAAVAESEFERQVGMRLTQSGYRVHPQWRVGSLTIDLVVIGADGKRAAVECDGDRFHPPEKLRDDLRRQMVLERLTPPWKFVRIRGSEFFRDPDATIERVRGALAKLTIEPIGAAAGESESLDRGRELLDRVIRQAAELRREWTEDDAQTSEDDEGVLPIEAVVAPSEHRAIEIQSSELEVSTPNDFPETTKMMLGCLRECGRALGRQEILDRTGVAPEAWQKAVSLLLGTGAIERTGSKRGTRYFIRPAQDPPLPTTESPDLPWS